MTPPVPSFDRACGGAAVVIGLLCLIESVRLFPLRNTYLSGDHGLPGLLGLVMIILGSVLLCARGPSPVKAVFPSRPIRLRVAATLALLTAYAIALAPLGYVVATAVVGVPLFRLFGGYRWLACVVASAACSLGLYGVFVLGLGMSFPSGLFF